MDGSSTHRSQTEFDGSGDTESDSSKDESPTDSSTSNSDNDNDQDNDSGEPTGGPQPSGPGNNLSAQPSFRKIAKKRRKAGGQSSFHHSKSSKEYLRKAQEAYQQLRISEQEQQNSLDPTPVGGSNIDSSTEAVTNSSKKLEKDIEEVDYGYGDPSESEPQEKVDYGYGDPADSEPQEKVDYGYGDPVESEPAVDYGYGDPTNDQPKEKVDYGYGDPDEAQQPQPRRMGRARRRNSVTKYSIQAANVVAAKAAAERIMKLKPSLTYLSRGRSSSPSKQRGRSSTPSRRRQHPKPSLASLSRGRSSTPSRQRRMREHESQRSNRIAAMQTALQKEDEQQEPQQQEQNNHARPAPPQRSSRKARDVFGNKGVISRKQSEAEEKLQYEGSSVSPHTITAPVQHLKLTSDYFSSDRKQNGLHRKNSGPLSGMALRFTAPSRTESWLSQNSFSTVNNNDDDDADSLASDMESLCSIRNNSFRLDNSHNALSFMSTDMPPVPPEPSLKSPYTVQASPSSLSKSRLTSPDHLSRFAGGANRSLVITWSSGSNEDGSLSNFDKTRAHRERRSNVDGKYPILPFPGPSNAARSNNSCMPAPINRTPSYKATDQRKI